jgi:hypothetical protein
VRLAVFLAYMATVFFPRADGTGRLDTFDIVIEAMGYTHHARFIVWKLAGDSGAT